MSGKESVKEKKDCKQGKGTRNGKEKEVVKDLKSKRATMRTDPYAAPFFFPSPASPDVDQYVATIRERPTPTSSTLVSPDPVVASSPAPPLVSVTRNSTKGKRRLFASQKRNKSDVVS